MVGLQSKEFSQYIADTSNFQRHLLTTIGRIMVRKCIDQERTNHCLISVLINGNFILYIPVTIGFRHSLAGKVVLQIEDFLKPYYSALYACSFTIYMNFGNFCVFFATEIEAEPVFLAEVHSQI